MQGYSLLRKLLFTLDPETAHHTALRMLRGTTKLPLHQHLFEKTEAPLEVLGLPLGNPVGLAAGFDKNAEYLDEMQSLGFGFLEVGTVTPKPQEGNPRPRLFRLSEQRAVINRMGFNNHGVDALVRNVKATNYTGVLGINIGANKDTADDKRIDDYMHCLEKVYEFASYVVINISSPNTPGLRNLQQPEWLSPLLSAIQKRVLELRDQQRREVPLLVKLAPDLSDTELSDIAGVCVEHKVSGIIATNTTISREMLKGQVFEDQTGGLSGAPLKPFSLSIVKKLRGLLPNSTPIVACGGIMSAEDALDYQAAGASCVQFYTGFVYRGPALIHEVARAWKN